MGLPKRPRSVACRVTGAHHGGGALIHSSASPSTWAQASSSSLEPRERLRSARARGRASATAEAPAMAQWLAPRLSTSSPGAARSCPARDSMAESPMALLRRLSVASCGMDARLAAMRTQPGEPMWLSDRSSAVSCGSTGSPCAAAESMPQAGRARARRRRCLEAAATTCAPASSTRLLPRSRCTMPEIFSRPAARLRAPIGPSSQPARSSASRPGRR
mmetsp:Transcript_13644/g.40243  ORF Transcript_13644/g.40243 Transcript_13644/m.40243 type:complete len:218 (-) Transcript_13644:973-1626(-)